MTIDLNRLPYRLAAAITALAERLAAMDANQAAQAPHVADWATVEKVLDAARSVVQSVANGEHAQPTE